MRKLEREKGVLIFFEEKCRKSVWPGYGEPKVELGKVNVLC